MAAGRSPANVRRIVQVPITVPSSAQSFQPSAMQAKEGEIAMFYHQKCRRQMSDRIHLFLDISPLVAQS